MEQHNFEKLYWQLDSKINGINLPWLQLNWSDLLRPLSILQKQTSKIAWDRLSVCFTHPTHQNTQRACPRLLQTYMLLCSQTALIPSQLTEFSPTLWGGILAWYSLFYAAAHYPAVVAECAIGQYRKLCLALVLLSVHMSSQCQQYAIICMKNIYIDSQHFASMIWGFLFSYEILWDARLVWD